MVQPVIRLAGPDDVAALARLRGAWHADGEEPGFEQRFAAWLAAEGDRRTVWLAEAAGGAVGMVAVFEYRRMPVPGRVDTAWGYLGHMFVIADQRGRGLGRLLLDAALEVADARGYRRVVLAPSVRSIPFYRRAGFVDAGPDADGHRLMVRPPPHTTAAPSR